MPKIDTKTPPWDTFQGDSGLTHNSNVLVEAKRRLVMAKVDILCYAHLLHKQIQCQWGAYTSIYCIVPPLLSWVTCAHSQCMVFARCIASGIGLKLWIRSSLTRILIYFWHLPPDPCTNIRRRLHKRYWFLNIVFLKRTNHLRTTSSLNHIDGLDQPQNGICMYLRVIVVVE